MKVNLKKLEGNWKEGFALDKHVLSSVYTGDNEYGRPTFDTTRSEAGEALYQLKYKRDWNQSEILAQEILASIIPQLNDNIGLIVPVPPSTKRTKQPVNELANSLAKLMNIKVFNEILLKSGNTSQLKDISDKLTKVELLKGKFSINDEITNDGKWNALVIDDLYDTGATLESACEALKSYKKINKIYVATATWK